MIRQVQSPSPLRHSKLQTSVGSYRAISNYMYGLPFDLVDYGPLQLDISWAASTISSLFAQGTTNRGHWDLQQTFNDTTPHGTRICSVQYVFASGVRQALLYVCTLVCRLSHNSINCILQTSIYIHIYEAGQVLTDHRLALYLWMYHVVDRLSRDDRTPLVSPTCIFPITPFVTAVVKRETGTLSVKLNFTESP